MPLLFLVEKGGYDMRKPTVSSLSMRFKRATNVIEDREEAKREHRSNLNKLVNAYMEKVELGEVDGIRNAKELVEVIKADLLLMGEADSRTENVNELDEVKVTKVSQAIDENDENVQALMNQVLLALNGANDDADDSPTRRVFNELPEDDEESEEE